MTPAPPIVQTQDFAHILSEALARIPVHNPEYTNYQNNTDPGVTILQLFAFMVDNLSYLCNQIPNQNLQKFLNLLGVPVTPAQAATGVVTFSNDRGPLQTVTLPPHVPVSAGSVSFVTTRGLAVLPVQSQVYLRASLSPAQQSAASQTYQQLYSVYTNPTTELQFYQTQAFDPPVSSSNMPVANLSDGSIVDRALWIALLTRPVDAGANAAVLNEIAGKTLTLGLAPASAASELVIQPAAPAGSQTPSPLVYEIATGQLNNGAPVYQRLSGIADANPLTELTLVQLTLPGPGSIGVWNLGPLEDGVGDFPPSLQDQDPTLQSRLITWIRVRLPSATDTQGPSTAQASFNWLDINAARVTQEIAVPVEFAGTGNGTPDQIFTLVNTPVLADTVQLTINGVPWTQTDDLLAAPSEVFGSTKSQVYTVDPASGTVTFGTGLQGARPNGAIYASYSYGGGVAGNVGIGAIQSSSQLPAGFKVSNPLPTTGGDAGETPDEAARTIPLYLQNAGRAVSAADFVDIVNQTPGVNLGRVEVIPLYNPDSGTQAPGVVTVMVIPEDPNNPQGPVPDLQFLQAVCSYLEPRRLLTTEIHVVGPDYQGLTVSVGFDVVAGQDIADVAQAVNAAISNYLSPLSGGPAGTGWPLQKPVVDRELLAQAARVPGISDIRNVLMWDGSGTAVQTLPIANLQLPRLDNVAANSGDPEDLTQQTSTAAATNLVPVPVLPAGC